MAKVLEVQVQTAEKKITDRNYDSAFKDIMDLQQNQ
jgi:hypothetical protein